MFIIYLFIYLLYYNYPKNLVNFFYYLVNHILVAIAGKQPDELLNLRSFSFDGKGIVKNSLTYK